MEIRRAEEKDLSRMKDLLSQVLEIHASIRPDLFIPGTTKYTDEELLEIFKDDMRPVFVAADENDQVVGYAFCVMHDPVDSNNMIPHGMLYIDDLVVDQSTRGKHVGRTLFEYVKAYAKEQGCYHVTLNVWEGNDSARKFYESVGLKVQKTVMETIL